MRKLLLCTAVASAAVCHEIAAQAAASSADSSANVAARFVARARQATERYKDINVAIADNYVKVGPDFPAMGEHWVNGELIMKGGMDPRPAILTYVTVGGKQTLLGAVYALVLHRGEQPPPIPASAQWHDHVGTIDEESLLFGHDHMAGDEDVRLAVMHAWIWTPNPAGMFATDNWALPFVRLGVSPPEHLTWQASRAAALLAGAASYYDRLFAAAGELDERESPAVTSIVERHRATLQRWCDSRPPASPVSAADELQLRTTWERLANDVGAAVRPANALRLQRVLAP
jgi:hypothetical protein